MTHKPQGDITISSLMKKFPEGRVVSIDALRGFDMFWIIGGGSFFLGLFHLVDTPFTRLLTHQLHHSQWNGFTFEDLIFPLFLFIVGVSMPFSLTKRLNRGDTHKDMYIHILKRTVILFFLGLIFNGLLDFNFNDMRYAGVLQRISLCYLFTAIIVMNSSVRSQGIWIGTLLISYWAIMKLIPVPGYGLGVLTPEGNFSGYIDRLFLPGSFCCYEFGDNEGIMSTIPAIATTLLGVLNGHWLSSSVSQNKKVYGLVTAGVISLILALVWNLLFPINKLIWSSSYVLFSGGWCMVLLALFYWLIDVRGYRKWAFPFIVIGLNPITIYVAQGLFDFGIIADIFIHGFVNHLGAFKVVFRELSVLTVKWLFLYYLYRQRLFLKA